MQIIFSRTTTVRQTLITLFEYLLWLDRNELVVFDEEKLEFKNIKKTESEIVRLPFDYSRVEKKIYAWFFTKQEELKLSQEETMCFLECVHAAEFYSVAQNYDHYSKNIIVPFSKRLFLILEECSLSDAILLR